MRLVYGAEATEIYALLHQSVNHLDSEEWDQWLKLFADEAVYTLLCRDSATEKGTYIVDTNKAGIASRLDLLKKEPNRRREELRMLHIPSWGAITEDREHYFVTSKFAVYETKAIDGVSRLAYVGAYRDEIGRADGWIILARHVALDTFTFKSMVIPI